MPKKLSVGVLGVAAGLVVLAPTASANEEHHEDNDGGQGNTELTNSCNTTAGEATANGSIPGESLAGNTLSQAPVGGANVMNITCNDVDVYVLPGSGPAA